MTDTHVRISGNSRACCHCACLTYNLHHDYESIIVQECPIVISKYL